MKMTENTMPLPLVFSLTNKSIGDDVEKWEPSCVTGRIVK